MELMIQDTFIICKESQRNVALQQVENDLENVMAEVHIL